MITLGPNAFHGASSAALALLESPNLMQMCQVS